MGGYLGSYATLGLLLLVGLVFFAVAFAANRLLRPARPASRRASWQPTSAVSTRSVVTGHRPRSRYYVYAYLYVLFAVESVFLFPWAVIFDRPGFGVITVVEMAIFVGCSPSAFSTPGASAY